MLRVLVIVFLALSIASLADPFSQTRHPLRSVKDRCVQLLTLGLFGKPNLLVGVRTPRVWWGPHSLKDIFTHFLGVSRGRGPIWGKTYFGHPFGIISLSVTDSLLKIEVNNTSRLIETSTDLILELCELFPMLQVKVYHSRFGYRDWTPGDQDPSGTTLTYQLSREGFLPGEIGDSQFQYAAQFITDALLTPERSSQ